MSLSIDRTSKASQLTAMSNPSRSHGSALPMRRIGEAPIIPFDPASDPRDKRDESLTSSRKANIVSGTFQKPYTTISNMLGFREAWSLTWFIIFAGAIVGFALARSEMLDPSHSVYKKQLAGEWFWNSRAPYRVALVVHVWTCFIIAWGIVIQFIPAIYRDHMILHRLNGYGLLVLISISVATAWVCARRAQGGEPVVQAIFYILGLLILVTGMLGMVYVRDAGQHRKWMLRMASLLGVVVSARLIMVIARAIISDMGTYYSMLSCNEIRASTGSFSKYPACVAAQNVKADLGFVYVGIQASTKQGGIHFGAGTRLATALGWWIAFIIHIVGVELYIHLTEHQNRHREGFVLTGGEHARGSINQP